MTPFLTEIFGRKPHFILLLLCLGVILTACSGLQQPANLAATVDAVVKATQQANVNVQATVDAAVAATLQAQQLSLPTATPVVIQATPIPVDTSSSSSSSDVEQIQTTINNEINGAVSQDLALLQSIYAPDAIVVDRAGTPQRFDDDTTWQGWPNIERRYQAFFSGGVSSMALVNMAVHINGDQALVTHDGAIMDDVFYPDHAVYTLAKRDDHWLITGLEYGNQPPPAEADGAGSGVVQKPAPAPANDGLYDLAVGNQHRYEEPWGWDRGDPCTAWQTHNFDDTKPYYRGFNVELLLTNHSDKKVPDDWPITFTTAGGKTVKACYYRYKGSGPPPGATSSVTFFTVVEQGDFVDTITLNLESQTVKLCLDGRGGWWRC